MPTLVLFCWIIVLACCRVQGGNSDESNNVCLASDNGCKVGRTRFVVPWQNISGAELPLPNEIVFGHPPALMFHGLNSQLHWLSMLLGLLHWSSSSRIVADMPFEIAVRDYVWFESDRGYLKSWEEFTKYGVKGILRKEWSSIVNFGFDHISLKKLHENTDGRIDVLTWDEKKMGPCAEPPLHYRWNNLDFVIEEILCIPASTSIHNWQLLMLSVIEGDDAVVAIPQGIMVPEIIGGVLHAPEFADHVLQAAAVFIKEHFDNEPFLAVHWRQGDRNFVVEMGVSGVVQTLQSAPHRLIRFINEHKHLRGIKHVFIATNSGSDSAIMEVLSGCGGVLFDGDKHWQHAAFNAAVEQAICAESALFVMPPSFRAEPGTASMFTQRIFGLRQQKNVPNKIDSVSCCGDEKYSKDMNVFASHSSVEISVGVAFSQENEAVLVSLHDGINAQGDISNLPLISYQSLTALPGAAHPNSVPLRENESSPFWSVASFSVVVYANITVAAQAHGTFPIYARIMVT